MTRNQILLAALIISTVPALGADMGENYIVSETLADWEACMETWHPTPSQTTRVCALAPGAYTLPALPGGGAGVDVTIPAQSWAPESNGYLIVDCAGSVLSRAGVLAWEPYVLMRLRFAGIDKDQHFEMRNCQLVGSAVAANETGVEIITRGATAKWWFVRNTIGEHSTLQTATDGPALRFRNETAGAKLHVWLTDNWFEATGSGAGLVDLDDQAQPYHADSRVFGHGNTFQGPPAGAAPPCIDFGGSHLLMAGNMYSNCAY